MDRKEYNRKLIDKLENIVIAKSRSIEELEAKYNKLLKENKNLKTKLQAQPKLSKPLTLREFITIACEYKPTIAEDSGQPEWSNGELTELFNALTEGHWLYINRPKMLSKERIRELINNWIDEYDKDSFDLAEIIFNAQSNQTERSK